VDWLCVPLLFVLAGWLPAQWVTGRRFSGGTVAWAALFSVVLLPPLCFGLAMALGTVVTLPLAVTAAGAMALAGLAFALKRREDPA